MMFSDLHGDHQPEDGWDDGDDQERKIEILVKVVEALRSDFHAARRDDALRLVNKIDDRKDSRIREIRRALERLR